MSYSLAPQNLNADKNSVIQTQTLMIQGTTSDAGKTTLVAGLCRIFARQAQKNNQYKVAPFKPQNMALNSAVTIDGGEIGRAQALQAIACYLAPHTDFNPVLLKPASDTQAQVIIQGKALTALEAEQFWGEKGQGYKTKAMDAVIDSYQRLQNSYEIIFVEGAGSPAEINLRQGDIANMGFAEAVDCPVILIADIDKGGVFAQLVGTLALLTPSEQQRIKGFVINRFRGDISLLQSGIDWLEQYTGKPVIGVLPYLDGLHLDAEDALITDSSNANQQSTHSDLNKIKVQVLVYPRISNHTDFDSLRLHPYVEFSYIDINQESQSIPAADLIILPGSKNVRQDLAVLIENGFDKHINRHLRYGGKVIGICGGYQMLGLEIDDKQGFDGQAGASEGLGLLPLVTEFKSKKQLYNVSGYLELGGQKAPVKGYEIHCGDSYSLRDLITPFNWQRQHHIESDNLTYFDDHKKQRLTGTDFIKDGLMSDDGQILGTYLHGLFDLPQASDLLLEWAGLSQQHNAVDVNALREQQLNRLADEIEAHLNMPLLTQLLLDKKRINNQNEAAQFKGHNNDRQQAV